MSTIEIKHRKPPVLLDDAELAVIDRAIRLQHALDGNLDAPTQIADGGALVAIVSEWLETKTAAIRGGQNP